MNNQQVHYFLFSVINFLKKPNDMLFSFSLNKILLNSFYTIFDKKLSIETTKVHCRIVESDVK